ncbi:MAG TPA: YtxH domain-containing protein [Rectinemataceae bacterium]|nr:YtxH domain-containing protein [Rectinemataceae bacterium]
MFLNNMLDMVNRKKRDEDRRKASINFALGMGIAATIGLVKGILYAPKSGKETRDELKKKAEEALETIRGKVRHKAEIVRETTTRAAQELKSTLQPKPAAKKKRSGTASA